MKIMRIIMLGCLLWTFMFADSAVIGEEKAIKTTAELIAEVEASSQPATSSTVADEKTPKSAAEIMAEIEALSTPSTPATASAEPDNEQVASETSDELPSDTTLLPDEVIGEYAVDDTETEAASDTAVASETASIEEESEPEARFEKADPLEPQLMLAGTPAEEEAEAQVSEKLNGKIIAEKQPLNRRRYLYRWVLKTEDGRRIPLKSNIKLLQEVRRDDVLDSQVNLTGRFIKSGYNDKLQYFVVESVVVLDDKPSDEIGKSAAGAKKSKADSRKAVADSKK
ncbi:MAG: hypothetical protein ACD_39C00107G0001 [uncultured bacterium]|nr:MAG: hypothetical protein ACD_39C00107G0001 [uncultured bacterium]